MEMDQKELFPNASSFSVLSRKASTLDCKRAKHVKHSRESLSALKKKDIWRRASDKIRLKKMHNESKGNPNNRPRDRTLAERKTHKLCKNMADYSMKCRWQKARHRKIEG